MKKLNMYIAVAIMAAMSLVGCGNTENKENKEVKIEVPAFSVVVVTPEGEKTLTDETISGLKVVEAELVKKSKKGEQTNVWTGVDLTDALAEIDVTSFEKVTVEAADGYAQEYTQEVADKALLVYGVDGDVIGEEDGPTNTVIDGEAANLWMKNLAKITVE